jgi:hypothetical protein
MVTATNVATNIKISAPSGSEGLYRIDRLVLGTYTLSVEKAGFQTVIGQQIALSSAQTARFNFTLQVGSVEQTTTVTAEGDMSVLNTENAQLSNTFDWTTPNIFRLLPQTFTASRLCSRLPQRLLPHFRYRLPEACRTSMTIRSMV